LPFVNERDRMNRLREKVASQSVGAALAQAKHRQERGVSDRG
jgi:hypothetical protein